MQPPSLTSEPPCTAKQQCGFADLQPFTLGICLPPAKRPAPHSSNGPAAPCAPPALGPAGKSLALAGLSLQKGPQGTAGTSAALIQFLPVFPFAFTSLQIIIF